jgi:hypothetical protein
MSMHFSELAAQATAEGRIGADVILALRQAGWANGKLDPDEAEALFAANDRLIDASSDWCDFFVEALSEFIVNTVEPHGYVDDAMADELVARIDRDGRVGTMAELELLVRVQEKALNLPDSLKAYTLKQFEEAVMTGDGPTRYGSLDPAGVNASECALLRRLIFSSGGDRPASVSRAEAELLFRIKDATLFERNALEWEKLFVQGVANFLLGFGGHEPLSRERAADLESFMSAEGAGIGGFLSRVVSSRPDFDGAFGSLLDLGSPGADIAADAEQAAELTEAESSWLNDMLEADEDLDDLEKALIVFIDEETGGQFVPRRAAA